MESYKDVLLRFIENYRTNTGGINIYPQFDHDLELLLDWLCHDDAMGDVATNGDWIPTIECSWRPPEGE